MAAGRDNFTDDTIQRAARRVGYRCSFPECKNATVGASSESNSKVATTGVACHICAASERGPRYDKNMTSEERKSIENCIWMCQTHSKLIDTDTEKYTVELLKQWKKDAEEVSSRALANGDYFTEYYNSNGDNLGVIQQLFDTMIIHGRFDELYAMLQQYKTTLSDRYEEFILRYWIIYDVFCSRKSLTNHVSRYCGLPNKEGVDDLAKLFIAFELSEHLKNIKRFCISNNVRLFSDMCVSGELERNIIIPLGAQSDFQIPDELTETMSKFIVNHIRSHKIIGAIGLDGNALSLFSGEFYYHAIVAAHNIASMTVYGNDNYDAIILTSDFKFLSTNIKSIKLLDSCLQEFIWANLLSFLSVNNDGFQSFYKLCPDDIKENTSIKRATFISLIICDASSIDADTLLKFSTDTKEYTPLLMYLDYLDKNIALQLLDEHAYLYRESSIFLQIKYRLSFENSPNEGYLFLRKYEDIYKEDFTFQCLMVKCMPSSEGKAEKINSLLNHQSKISNYNLMLYIQILRENKCWNNLETMAKSHLPNEIKFYIAGYLTESEDDRLLALSQDLYQSLLDKKWDRRGIRFNIGLIQHLFGHVEAAKKCFRDEYDEYQSINALKKLMSLRYETHDYCEDKYLEQLKKCIDVQSQNCAGAIYLKLQNYPVARKCFLRSLLLNDIDNPGFNGFFQSASNLSQQNVEMISADTACTLKGTSKTLKIAIHSPEILQGISVPTRFAQCLHFSIEDETIFPLLYKEKDDCIIFNNEHYMIDSVSSADDVFLRFFFASCVSSESENAIAVYGSTAKEFIDKITPILKSNSKRCEKIIDEYNRQEVFPLSKLSVSIGQSMLKTYEFLLYGNKSFIRNNLSVLDENIDKLTIILSYDAIVTLAHLNIDLDKLPKDRMTCAQQVKNQLLNDIDDELSTISDEKQKASMLLSKGKPILLKHSSDQKRDRHTFLLRVKKFVKSIKESTEAYDYKTDNEELHIIFEQLFAKNKLYCEGGTLALTKNTTGGVLVSDDPFLYSVANTDNLLSIGVIGLLMSIYTGWEKLLLISKELHSLNFSNYFPKSLYKKIVDLLLVSDIDIENGSKKIQQWVLSDTEYEASEHHKDVVIALAREIYMANEQYLNPNNYFGIIVYKIMEERNPEYVQKLFSDAIKQAGDLMIID